MERENDNPRYVYQPLGKSYGTSDDNYNKNLEFEQLFKQRLNTEYRQVDSSVNRNRYNNNGHNNGYNSGHNKRKKRRTRRIKVVPCLILLIVVFLLVFGIAKIVTNNEKPQSFEEKHGVNVEMYLPTYAKDIWDDLLYVGDDVFNGSDNIIVISRAEYDAYCKQMGGEDNLERNLYLREVAQGDIQLPYMKNGSIFHVDIDEKIVALSFDDGPSAATIDKYLAILKEYNATATFFMLGQYMQSDSESVNKILDNGHEPATHTWSHKNFKKCSAQVVAEDLNKSVEVFRRIVGHDPYLMRCPYGNITDDVRSVNKSIGMLSIMWDIDTLDWKAKFPDQILNYVKQYVRPGSIILMHEGKNIDIQALPAVLKYLKDQGYKVVSVGELLWQAEQENK